ncbi:hypothetical protein PA598K_05315 [Paenibacillus sp. 598K]|uniref:ABC transporter substrate-binding protein n=1 Tax=Paenibacillus sp. 598K TaxID=1117987 RepID=UPI000FF9C645|nr:ABC transporter substrate-binding protein [Paenibacillus sp. 598K]GBF76823.1 hypothetical protein PA598K_05315 [Paenibacillus sp. 598K]
MFHTLQSFYRRAFLVGIIAIVLTVIAACGNGNADQKEVNEASNATGSQHSAPTNDTSGETEPSSEDEAQSSTRTFHTIKGDIVIPAAPQRVVTQGFLPYFLLFDIKPIGAPYWEIEYPHLAGLTDGIEDIGQIDGGSVEKILSLQPDLIVTVAQDMYEQYSKIAPTVVIPYESIGDAHKDLRLFGELLGKEAEAEAWLEDFDQKVESSKQELQTLNMENETFSLIGAFDKTYFIYGDGIYRGGQAMYKYLGLKPPAIIQEQVMDAGKETLEISMEVIPDYAGDHIFLDVSNGAVFDEKSALWNSIPAVKNNRVYRLNTDIFWPYDPLAVEMQLDEVLKLLKGSQ